MAFTDTYAASYMRSLCGQSSSAPQNQAWVGLSTTTPNADGTGFTEPSAAEYRRVCIGLASGGSGWSNKMTVTSTSGVGTGTSNDILYFPEALSSWGTVTHFGIFTSQTGGSAVIFGALTAPVTIQANYVPMFRAGALVLTIS